MVSPSASAAKEVSASAAEKNWREAANQAASAAESAESSQPTQAPAQLQFEVVYVQSTKDACKAVHRALTALRLVIFLFGVPKPAGRADKTCTQTSSWDSMYVAAASNEAVQTGGIA